MALDNFAVTATTTAAVLLPDDGSADFRRGQSVSISNAGPTTVYVGKSSVTAGNGYPLAAGDAIGLDLNDETEVIYGVAASGTQELRVLRTGV